MRAAGATYTAQEFNVLNDLNNLVINGRKLEETEKIEIIKEMKEASSVRVEKIIKRVIGEEIVSVLPEKITCAVIVLMDSTEHFL